MTEETLTTTPAPGEEDGPRAAGGPPAEPADPSGALEPAPVDGPPECAGCRALRAALPALREDLLGALEERHRQDRFREEQVERLHRELQDHRSDLLARTTGPLVLSLIRLHDELGRCGEAWSGKPPEEVTPERLGEILSGFQEDVEIELEGFGVESYRHPDDRFDPQWQQALDTEEAPRPDLAGRLVRRLRPGYARGGEVIRKEKVVVYRAAATPSTATPPSRATAGDPRHETHPDPEETT